MVGTIYYYIWILRCKGSDLREAGIRNNRSPRSIPMEKYSLEINDAVLEVVSQNERATEKYIRLINGVSAKFESGKVSVVMGASGSSKTTLISLIAGRVDPRSRTYGSILLNGRPRDPKTWLSKVVYLEQDDCIVPLQTVEEYINFSVRCRINKFHKSLLMTRRQMIHDWRTWGILKRWVSEMAYFWLILKFGYLFELTRARSVVFEGKNFFLSFKSMEDDLKTMENGWR